jgi:hypothetical protein
MTEVPKIVYDRLRTAELARVASGLSHPDPNLLTAFAEQTLLPEERQGVLEHLATCEDCREMVVLALPAEVVPLVPDAAEAEGDRTPLPKPGKRWLNAFAWPSLRWAALAAGVIVTGSVLLLHSNKQAVVVVDSSFPTAVAPAPTVPVQKAQPPIDQVSTLTSTDSSVARAKSSLSKKAKADHVAAAPVPPESGMLLADNKTFGARMDSFRPENMPAADSPALNLPAPQSMNETVEVSSSEAQVDVNAAPTTAGNLMARNEAPAVVRTKPAPPEIAAQQVTAEASGTSATKAARASGGATRAASMDNAYALKKSLSGDAPAPSFKLRITAGQLQRSVDDGGTWQVGLRADRPLLCYAAAGLEVWTGGEAGALFHSADGGVTWVEVQPAVKGQPLSASVVGIKVQPPQVLVATSNNETWSTADGGQTWDKR